MVGIVSASDIIQLFLNLHERPAGGAGAYGNPAPAAAGTWVIGALRF
jgi:hypothetical protein